MLKNFTTRHCEFVLQIIIKSISLQETNFLDKQTEFYFTKGETIKKIRLTSHPKLGPRLVDIFFTNGNVSSNIQGFSDGRLS